jgi:beta-lactamase regulating signal transducer with metallopeptidase domain
MAPFILDHLWQSTLLALALGLMTLAFRRSSAAVRHGLWFAASVKFLIPFAALAALGRRLAPALRLPRPAGPEAAFIAGAAQPFSRSGLSQRPLADFPFAHGPALQAPLAQAPAAAPLAHPDAAIAAVHAAPRLDLGLILLAVWALGSAAMLVLWARRWARLRKVVRSSRPVDWPAPMPVLAAPSLVEPGLVGLWRPVLLVPETLPGALPRSGIDAIVAHEAAHLRRRDNLTAALHMLVEALFWFHPLVWWIGGRLIAERERACDEAVLAAGHDRVTYARSLVESCRLYLQSPLDCVAGASGSDLKSRVEAIMTARPASPLSRSGKALLLAAGAFAFATPVMAGLLTTPEGQKVVAHAVAVASRAAPALLTPTPNPAAEPRSVPDEEQPAKPVVLAQNQSIVAPNLSIARLDVAASPLAHDVAAPRIAQPSPSVEAAPAPAPAEPVSPTDPKAQAASFVDFYASTDRHVLARWMAPVCIKVIGLPDDQANTVQRRVVAVAKAVGVRAQPESCKNPNVQIGFAPDPQNLLDGIAARTPGALGDWSSGTQDHKSIMLPIQAWYETNGGTVADNGTSGSSGLKVRVLYQAPPGPGSFTQSPSVDTGAAVSAGAWWGDDSAGRRNLQSGRFRPRSTTPRATRRAFENALVLVDTRRTGGKSLGVVSDYVALLALSQPGDLGRCNVLPSVTDLFANCPGRAAPDGLTPADAAFLTALYAAKTDKTGDEQADIAARMASILSADAEAHADAAPARAVKPASAVAPVAPSRQWLTPVATRAGDANPQVSAFVQSYGEAFWNQDKWICVRVEGLPSDKAAAVKARVEADARAVGVSVGRAECGLHNEVEIRFATDAERAVQSVLDYYHHPFWPFPMERPAGADRPIKAWYGMVYDFAGGAGGTGLGAHPNARRKLALSIVVVDPARTQDISLDTASDYAAVLALSQPRSLDRCNVLPSITDLYAGACPGRSAPAGLTAADTAFLTALYRGSPGIRATRSPSELVESVAKRLAGDRLAAL